MYLDGISREVSFVVGRRCGDPRAHFSRKPGDRGHIVNHMGFAGPDTHNKTFLSHATLLIRKSPQLERRTKQDRMKFDKIIVAQRRAPKYRSMRMTVDMLTCFRQFKEECIKWRLHGDKICNRISTNISDGCYVVQCT